MFGQFNKSRFCGRIVALTIVCTTFVGSFSHTVLGFSLRTAPLPLGLAQIQPKTTVSDGLRIVTVENDEARVTVKLPDDIRTGDKISGTIVSEPKGVTPEDRKKNEAAMRKRILRLMLTRAIGGSTGRSTSNPIPVTVPLDGGETPDVKVTSTRGVTMRIELNVSPRGALPPSNSAMKELGSTMIPIDIVEPDSPSDKPSDEQPVKKKPGPSSEQLEGSPSLAGFMIPTLGQVGRPIEITGPFDGSSENTQINLTYASRAPSTNKERSDLPLEVIAESPRKAILENPSDVTGASRITVNDGNSQTSAPFRNLRVSLSAPKTSLLKGETTLMRVEVVGLSGITQPIPMTLISYGVITIDGGPFQRVTIAPSQVSSDGSYVTTRKITGVEAGGWGARANVIVREFDIYIEDDANPRIRLMFNSSTGAYEFWNPAARNILSGRGTVGVKGCTVSLVHPSSDRSVSAMIDTCTNAGNASVQTGVQKLSFTITDSDMTNNLGVVRDR